MYQFLGAVSLLNCSTSGGRRRASLVLYLAIRRSRSSLNRARTFLACLTCLFKRDRGDKCSTDSSFSLSSVSSSSSGSFFGRLVAGTARGNGFGRHFTGSPYCGSLSSREPFLNHDRQSAYREAPSVILTFRSLTVTNVSSLLLSLVSL